MKFKFDTKKECREWALNELRKLQKNDDTEHAHSYADDVLCELLRFHGFGDVVDEYEAIDKWYA